MNKLFSPSLLLLLIMLLSLLVPKGHAMTNAAPETKDDQSHCAQMMDEKAVDQSNDSPPMDCCDECECSMAGCSNLLSLAAFDVLVTVNISNLIIIPNHSIYLEPVKILFKPPKIL